MAYDIRPDLQNALNGIQKDGLMLNEEGLDPLSIVKTIVCGLSAVLSAVCNGLPGFAAEGQACAPCDAEPKAAAQE